MDPCPTPTPTAPFESRYALGETIGSGSFGLVHRAMHRAAARLVAVKIVRGPGAREQARGRFRREARALGRIDHPGVLRMLDYFEEPDRLFMVSELVPGRTLADLLDAEAPLAPARAIDLVEQLIEALSAVHGAGFVHRDVKPANVMVYVDRGGRERVKLIDFGVSAELDASAELGEIVGTPRYMAPEQMLPGADERADLFAVGAVLYEMLAGRPAFPGRTLHVLLSQRAVSAPAPLDPRLGVGPRLTAVVDRALAPDVHDRWAAAAQMARALTDCRLEARVRARATRTTRLAQRGVPAVDPLASTCVVDPSRPITGPWRRLEFAPARQARWAIDERGEGDLSRLLRQTTDAGTSSYHRSRDASSIIDGTPFWRRRCFWGLTLLNAAAVVAALVH